MVRAVRLAAVLEFAIEPATLEAIRANAPLAAHVSGERVAAELGKLLAAERPSTGLRLLAETGLLAVVLPELDAQRGVPQNKVEGEDLFDHTIRTVDAAPAGRPVVRWRRCSTTWASPRPSTTARFAGTRPSAPSWRSSCSTGSTCRGPGRAASSTSSGTTCSRTSPSGAMPASAGSSSASGRTRSTTCSRFARPTTSAAACRSTRIDLAELRRRVDAELAASVVLDLSRLAIDGDDLMAELGLPAGPRLGRILDELLERVIADPRLNDRATLLLLAESMLADDR